MVPQIGLRSSCLGGEQTGHLPAGTRGRAPAWEGSVSDNPQRPVFQEKIRQSSGAEWLANRSPGPRVGLALGCGQAAVWKGVGNTSKSWSSLLSWFTQPPLSYLAGPPPTSLRNPVAPVSIFLSRVLLYRKKGGCGSLLHHHSASPQAEEMAGAPLLGGKEGKDHCLRMGGLSLCLERPRALREGGSWVGKRSQTPVEFCYKKRKKNPSGGRAIFPPFGKSLLGL